MVFHNTADIADVVSQLQAEGWIVDPLDLTKISPPATSVSPRTTTTTTGVPATEGGAGALVDEDSEPTDDDPQDLRKGEPTWTASP